MLEQDREGEVDSKYEMRKLLADASLQTVEVVDLVLSCADVWYGRGEAEEEAVLVEPGARLDHVALMSRLIRALH